MSDLVGNPKDRFSPDATQFVILVLPYLIDDNVLSNCLMKKKGQKNGNKSDSVRSSPGNRNSKNYIYKNQ